MRKSIRERFADMTRLYHFTDFSSACKIIESKKLRFGKMFKMNDLIESNRIVFERLALLDLEESKNNSLFAEKEMHRYQQISFSQDRKHNDAVFMGFDLHTMWGLYANRGYGVCLVFDKDKLKLRTVTMPRMLNTKVLFLRIMDLRIEARLVLNRKFGEDVMRYSFISVRSGSTNKSIVLFAGLGMKWMMSIWMYPKHYHL